ncbi:hypothetical protein [Dyella sp.]|uniref:hypothetical protein n=1 Tax=Dyella sp. TaxID=1869338 RepID=UPI002B4A9138|nr:hypothetical protein [Dyella sp.]HKT28277.1 hypothetical protein [Dyella sp.]
MVSEFRPLIEVLRELQVLVQKKMSGHFFIATESNHSSMILLRNGHVDEVTFSRYRSDEAVKQLANVSGARARFQPGKVDTSASRTPLGEAALQWLLGGFERDAAVTPRAAPVAAPAPRAASPREVVEKVTLTYLGPIGTLICDEAFSSADNLDQVLQQISSNLSTPEESKRFLEEARAALGNG